MESVISSSAPSVSTISSAIPSLLSSSMPTSSFQRDVLKEVMLDLGVSDSSVSDDDGCRWEGVTCLFGKVTRLSLFRENLGGTLSTKIGLLKNLGHVDLCKFMFFFE